jgi:hypothetical protein
MLYNESKHNISLPWWARPTKRPNLSTTSIILFPICTVLIHQLPLFVRRRRRRRREGKGREGKGLSNMVVNK